jgi:hypothetical protein
MRRALAGLPATAAWGLHRAARLEDAGRCLALLGGAAGALGQRGRYAGASATSGAQEQSALGYTVSSRRCFLRAWLIQHDQGGSKPRRSLCPWLPPATESDVGHPGAGRYLAGMFRCEVGQAACCVRKEDAHKRQAQAGGAQTQIYLWIAPQCGAGTQPDALVARLLDPTQQRTEVS